MIAAEDAAAIPFANFVWSSSGAVGVWGGPLAGGHRVIQLDESGEPLRPVQTIWPNHPRSQRSELAVAGDVLAVVDQMSAGANARQECVLGLVRLTDLTSILEPTRFSDPTEDESILNESHLCQVADTRDGFLVVWEQYTSRTSSEWSLFAQQYALDGSPRGERLTLSSGGDFSKVEAVSLTSEGQRATVAHTQSPGNSTALTIIEGAQVSTVPLPLVGPLQVRAAHGGLIAQTTEQAWLLDANGGINAGPADLAYASLGPLGEGYVSVATEDFLVARTVGSNLVASSEPAGLSLDRTASRHQLIFAPDGSWTAMLYAENGELQLSRLSCSAESGPAPGPPACPESPGVDPLDDGCTEEVCHLAIRLDYQTLGLRGYASTGGPRSVVDATQAADTARVVFDANSEYLFSETAVSASQAGVFLVSVSPADFGAFALVGANSGQVIAAGGVMWMGHGDYWAPSAWGAPGDVACGETAVTPADTVLGPAECDAYPLPTTVATPAAALDVALRTNLALHYAEMGTVSAFVYLYTPTVGGCDASVAEYIVVLTRG